MAEKKQPTKGDVDAIGILICRWPEVVERESERRTIDILGRDQREDAGGMLTEYLLRSAGNYIRRYLPDRSEGATGAEIVRALDALLREPRGAFRAWCKSMAMWVRRDLIRAQIRRGEKSETHLHYVRDGSGLAWDMVEDEGADLGDLFAVDDSRAVIADLMAMVCEEAPEALEDVALFLAHEEQGGTHNAYKAHGTNRGAVVSRLARLRPLAERVIAEHARDSSGVATRSDAA